jgi:hypothetical protein
MFSVGSTPRCHKQEQTIQSLHCKLQTRPLVREGAPQKQDRKFHIATIRQEVISGHKSHKGAWYQDILTGWLTVSHKLTSFSFSHRIRPPECLLTLNGWNIPFVNSSKYLSVIFYKKITWRLHIQTVATKTYRTFVTLYSLFKTDWLSTNCKLTLHKALIRSIRTDTYPTWWSPFHC